MLGTALVGGALAVAAGDWVAVALSARRAEYLLKPLALAVLLAAAVTFHGQAPELRWALTVTALALSLVGDVFLMLPTDRFVSGLAAFLLAHVAYVGAFNTEAPPLVPTAIAASVVAAAAVPLYLRMLRSMSPSTRRAMAAPVGAYVVAIGAMVVSAAVTVARPGWSAGSAALAVGGALLFMLSDGLIGWTRFVRPLPRGRLAVMATYHVAQAALVLGLLGSPVRP